MRILKLLDTSLLFPEPLKAPDSLETQFPPRALDSGAWVTRVGPSPTGKMHIGTLYVGLLNYMLARQSDGVSILRIEDTDRQREVDGATSFIVESLKDFGVQLDEGPDVSNREVGAYGPYFQSHRKDIYQSFAKLLVERGKAYPCFATKDELEETRERQRSSGFRTGYYGAWATWRDRNCDDVDEALKSGKPWVLRFRSPGRHENKIAFNDCVFGDRETSENDQDVVILKGDGLPTYHFAHVIDDHLMRTTHVIRGDEWLASVPLHLQLFEAFGWEEPKYAHVAPINKMDGDSRRKLSKRKDPEASVRYFAAEGYPRTPVLEYLLTLADSGFEAWRAENPTTSLFEFPITLENLQTGGGPIFDFKKLQFLSKEYIANLSAIEVFDQGLAWAQEFDGELATQLLADRDYALSALSIERGGDSARKDIRRWTDLRREIGYFFDDWFFMDRSTVASEIDFLT